MTARKRPAGHASERAIHRACLRYLELTFAGAYVHHGAAEAATGAEWSADRRRNYFLARAADGVRTGHPDLSVYRPGAVPFHVEVKSATGRLSEAQRECHAALERIGHAVIVARSIDELRDALAARGLLPGPRSALVAESAWSA